MNPVSTPPMIKVQDVKKENKTMADLFVRVTECVCVCVCVCERERERVSEQDWFTPGSWISQVLHL